MPVRRRTFAVVLVATIALATTWALAAAVRPVTHRFVKGEHFRYSNVLTIGGGVGESVIADDGPATMKSIEDFDVIGVSPGTASLAYHAHYDKATLAKASVIFYTPGTQTIRASRDGTWRYASGRTAENCVTWDRVQLGPQPRALTTGQRWAVDVPRNASSEPAHAAVRVVSVDPDNLALHVEGTGASAPHGDPDRITNRWSIDVVFAHGIVRELHRVDVSHVPVRIGSHRIDDRVRFERRVRLLTHTTP